MTTVEILKPVFHLGRHTPPARPGKPPVVITVEDKVAKHWIAIGVARLPEAPTLPSDVPPAPPAAPVVPPAHTPPPPKEPEPPAPPAPPAAPPTSPKGARK